MWKSCDRMYDKKNEWMRKWMKERKKEEYHKCMTIYLIASLLSVHCVSPNRRFHKPRWISTLKTKYHLLWLPPWPQPIVEYVSLIQGRLQYGAKIEDFKYLSKGKVFLVPTLSLSPLFLRTSKRLSMGEEVGTMQF
jgi:hypothetical protein